MLTDEQRLSPLPYDLRADKAVYVDGIADVGTAREMLEQVIAVVELINAPQVQVWAEAGALPLLAVAAAGLASLPEGFPAAPGR